MAESDAGGSGERTRSDNATSRVQGGVPPGPEGVFTDFTALASLIIELVRDAARLLGLETRLVIKTVVVMVALGVVLGIVLVGVWLSFTVIIAVGLYEFTGVGLAGSVALAALLNLACAGTLIVILRKLAARLSYPETRLALRSLLQQASEGLKNQANGV